MYSRVFCLGAALLLVGCTTAVTPIATGGSRADGIVEMSYEYGAYVTPQVDDSAALRSAIKRCKTWGYESAEAFDAGLRSCASPGGFGCDLWRVTTEYQCIHSAATSTSAQTVPTESATAVEKNFRDEIRQIQQSMACSDGVRILSSSEESDVFELDCGDGETLRVRCFDDDCYIR